MTSHELARRLLELHDQFIFIHHSDPDKAYRVNHIVVMLNGIVLVSELPEKKGGQL